jgi:hypothetical protein
MPPTGSPHRQHLHQHHHHHHPQQTAPQATLTESTTSPSFSLRNPHNPASTLNPLLHPGAHVFGASPPPQFQQPPMSMPNMGGLGGIPPGPPPPPSQIFGPAAGMSSFPNAMQTILPTQPQDYTTFSALTGNNLETMPLASPHYPGPGGVGYPNAMPLCRSVEVLPGPGSYGHPRHPTFCKPGEPGPRSVFRRRRLQ